MKKLSFLFLLFAAFSSPVSSNATAMLGQRCDIVIEDTGPTYISVNPNDYMNAQSVTVKLLDANNNVISSRVTSAGYSVTFARTGREYKVSCIYSFSDNNSIIIDMLVIN